MDMTTAGVPAASNAKSIANALVALATPAKVPETIPFIGKRHWIRLNRKMINEPTIAINE